MKDKEQIVKASREKKITYKEQTGWQQLSFHQQYVLEEYLKNCWKTINVNLCFIAN